MLQTSLALEASPCFSILRALVPRPWPAMIEMDSATKAKVDALWAKLGL